MAEYGGITQVQFIAILFDDCGYTGAQRREWLEARYGARYCDELTVEQRSQIIELLRAEKGSLAQ